MPGEHLSLRKRVLFAGLLIVGVPVGAFVLLEGTTSFALLTMDLASRPKLPPERRYTEYDPDLGWISRSNVHLPDMYGPGIPLTTNAQRFRHRGPVAPRVMPGKLRVICSGDSFALGFGVGDDDTWCQRLAAQDKRLEPVNMGQAGYGVDQAYLWYRRDAAGFDHHLHLFTFIWDDLTRMNSRAFAGYGKPVLALADDSTLRVENVPVPRRAYLMPTFSAWVRQSREALSDLRTFEAARRVRAALTDREAMRVAGDTATYRLAERVFLELDSLNRARGSRLVLVHLPAPDDAQYEPARFWRVAIRALAEREGLVYIDLGEDLGRLPPDSLDRIFRPDMHYTEMGNEWVARRLHAHLATVPSVAARLRSAGSPGAEAGGASGGF